jgi:hypothetical protein
VRVDGETGADHLLRGKFEATLKRALHAAAIPHSDHCRRRHTDSASSANSRAGGIPCLMVCRRTIVEHVLAVVGDDHPARSRFRNPHVDPSLADSDAADWLLNPSHEEVVFKMANRSVSHATADAT